MTLLSFTVRDFSFVLPFPECSIVSEHLFSGVLYIVFHISTIFGHDHIWRLILWPCLVVCASLLRLFALCNNKNVYCVVTMATLFVVMWHGLLFIVYGVVRGVCLGPVFFQGQLFYTCPSALRFVSLKCQVRKYLCKSLQCLFLVLFIYLSMIK